MAVLRDVDEDGEMADGDGESGVEFGQGTEVSHSNCRFDQRWEHDIQKNDSRMS